MLIICFYFLWDPFGDFWARIPHGPVLGAYAASQVALLHRRFHKFKSLVFVLLRVVCFQKQPFKFLLLSGQIKQTTNWYFFQKQFDRLDWNVNQFSGINKVTSLEHRLIFFTQCQALNGCLYLVDNCVPYLYNFIYIFGASFRYLA